MPLTVVAGGQFGGEGKGLITAYLARADSVAAVVKTGGPNCAHTFWANGAVYKVRMMPSGCNLGASAVFFPAGCLIYPPQLLQEIDSLAFRGKVVIDSHAGVIRHNHIDSQTGDPFYETCGSTRTGTGAASAERARRRLGLASDEPLLRRFIGDVADEIDKLLRSEARVLVEGSQGFALSNYHGSYPYVTSRDTTTAAFLSQIGVGTKYLETVVLTLKCFPTRNAEGKGPLPFEFAEPLSPRMQEQLWESGGGSYLEGDRTRRVGLFDFATVKRACLANSPTVIAVTGLDRLAALHDEPRVYAHYGTTMAFIKRVADELSVPVGLQGWGPAIETIRDVR